MAFYERATLLSTLPIQAGDTPGYPAGTRFIDNGEAAEVEVVNRALAALAENTDDLNDRIESDIAVPAVTAFTFASPDDEIVIDPTNVSGDIQFLGALFMGSSGWSDTKAVRDDLFQFLDDNYNEVLVDGEEVYVGGTITGAAIGDAFHSSAAVTIELRTASQNPVTVPAGNYRLGYFVGGTVGTLDEAVFVGVSVRGLQESAAEVQQKAMWVCAPAGGGPADFVGSSAFEDALTQLGNGAMIFLKAGTYSVPATFSNTDLYVIGESRSTTVLDITSGNMVVNGARVTFENLTVQGQGVGSQKVELSDDNITFRNCDLTDLYVESSGAGNQTHLIEGCTVGGYDRAILVSNTARVIIRNVACTAGSVYTSPLIEVSTGATGVYFENVVTSAVAGTQDILSLASCTRVKFSNCYFKAYDGRALVYAKATAPDVSFEGCGFESRLTVVQMNPSGVAEFGAQNMRMAFSDCEFKNIASGTYDDVFIELVSDSMPDYLSVGNEPGIYLTNCKFVDSWCALSTLTSHLGKIHFRGVAGDNVVIDRSGVADIVADSSELYTRHTRIRGLHIDVGGTSESVVSSPSYAAIEVYAGSVLEEVHVVAPFNTNWDRLLFYLEGENASAGRGLEAVVDGVTIEQAGTPTPWTRSPSNPGPVMAEVSQDGVLRRLKWNSQYNSLGDSNNNQGFIVISGDDGVVEGCELDFIDGSLDCSTAYPAVISINPSAGDVNRGKIEKNYIRVRSTAFRASYHYGIALSDSHECLVHGNTIDWDGPANDALELLPIILGTDAILNRITENVVTVTEVTGSTTARGCIIEIGSGTHGSGGDTQAGANICIGNILHNTGTNPPGTGNAAAKYIYDGGGTAVIGAAMNVAVQS